MSRHYNDYDKDFDVIDIKKIQHIYQLRHACSVFGAKSIIKKNKWNAKRVLVLINSDISGSVEISQLFTVTNNEFEIMVKDLERKNIDFDEVITRHQNLISDLQDKRKTFAEVGINKAKRRLNKLAKVNPIAKAVRLALEIEDKNICAKDSYGEYQTRIYKQKTKLIIKLADLFKTQGWTFGIQASDIFVIDHIIYFEIPGCEQISWHCSLENSKSYPKYNDSWDCKKNSTIAKLEKLSIQLFKKGLDINSVV